MKSLYFDLLKEWCDSLLSLQLKENSHPGLHGGIMCPACARIHGRCGDAVYPLLYMAHATGNKSYLDAAVKLQVWAENMSSPDGSWVNEPESSWKAITVFGVISLGEALRHHGELLDKDVYDRWLCRMKAGADYVYRTFTMDTGNINYPMTASAALTLAGMLLGEAEYLRKGRELAHNSLSYITQNGLVFGEGRPQNGVTPKGCRPVDLGYNVEESLGALALYGTLTGDEEVLGAVAGSLREHLEFMLPDGAWDNSWGSRSFKWSYWGSRTSDGCQTAYGMMAGYDSVFLEAARRNTLLMKACTRDGILYGGPHYVHHGELPCIHHTFTHAKALAALLDCTDPNSFTPGKIVLPRENAVGVREYPEIATWLAAIGPWRATITSYDWEYMKEGHPSGGSVSMLWHNQLGPVLAGSLTEYALVEPANMQRVKDSLSLSLTPRLELVQNGISYRSSNDFKAEVTYEHSENQIIFRSNGKLVDANHQSPASGEIPFIFDYTFKDDSFEISVKGDFGKYNGSVLLYLPIISDVTEAIHRMDDRSLEIIRNNRAIKVLSSSPYEILECCKGRVFNHVPGLQAIPLYIRPETGAKIKIAVS